MYKLVVALIFLIYSVINNINGHGRFLKPPNRSSIWRFPGFIKLNPPTNYNDNELFCGGIHQVDTPGSNCGVCGDPFNQQLPRDNEINGKWYRGIITGQYISGQVIDVEVDITAAHKGYMEWRLCDSINDDGETQECFNKYLLQREDGGGSKLLVDRGARLYETQLRLPIGIKCTHCVIQWNYRAGNRWGNCKNRTEGLGCGPQETFRGCSDISIN